MKKSKIHLTPFESAWGIGICGWKVEPFELRCLMCNVSIGMITRYDWMRSRRKVWVAGRPDEPIYKVAHLMAAHIKDPATPMVCLTRFVGTSFKRCIAKNPNSAADWLRDLAREGGWIAYEVAQNPALDLFLVDDPGKHGWWIEQLRERGGI